MANRLSHSAVSKFTECPRAFDLHYNHKLRPVVQSSALLFGTAVDKALEAMLKGENAEEAFKKAWTNQDINKNDVRLFNSLLVAYYNSDFDSDLLLKEDWINLDRSFHQTEIQFGTPNTDSVKSILEEAINYKKSAGLSALPEELQKLVQYAFWLSLKRKGLLMIKALRELIFPNIEQVLSTQEQVNLKNDVGDTVIGFVDFVAKYKGYDKPIIFDLKTSSTKYEIDKVINSPQLSLYLHDLEEKYKTRLAGYIVLMKKVRKNKIKICSVCQKDGTGFRHKNCDNIIADVRCGGNWNETIIPSIDVQVIVDEIPRNTEDLTLETIDKVNEEIKTGEFPQNFDSCQKPYGKCVFYDLCHGGKMDNLIDMKEKIK